MPADRLQIQLDLAHLRGVASALDGIAADLEHLGRNSPGRGFEDAQENPSSRLTDAYSEMLNRWDKNRAKRIEALRALALVVNDVVLAFESVQSDLIQTGLKQ
jgi:hypothetical protein